MMVAFGSLGLVDFRLTLNDRRVTPLRFVRGGVFFYLKGVRLSLKFCSVTPALWVYLKKIPKNVIEKCHRVLGRLHLFILTR